jgi:type IV pilus assembly protein PilV
MASKHIRGFTMLEVLVALLIFSLGLLGVAGLLTVSVKTNHAAYLRTQATFLAQGMADRMRANVLGLWNNSYNLPLTAVTNATVPTTCTTGTCAYSAVAARDLVVWQNQLAGFLPAPKAMIACAATSTPSAAQILLLPPFAGTCEIEITWSDSSNTEENSASTQVFDWVFQP